MELTINTYGYRDALYYTLNALAMFRNSGLYESIINSATVLIGSFYGLRMASSGNYVSLMLYARKTIGMLIFANLILLPKTEMILRDHVGKTIDKIDNIPMAFAVPVGMIENFGQVITLGFEQVFAPIESAINPNNPVFSYYNYGMIFGARLKQEVSQVRIKNPEFVGNMKSFIKRCVVLPSAIGHQFTMEELVSSKDMWQLVSSKAGTLTRTDVTINKERTTMNCKEAAQYFENYWKGENTRIIDKFKDTDFGKARSAQNYGAPANTLSKLFENNVKVLHQGLKPAGDILRQQMMINSISDYRGSSYGVARARMQQETGGILSGDIAGLTIPMGVAIFKCILYSAFIFLMPMMLFSGGLYKYTSYLTLAASLQLWPALNAVLNMIIGTYSNLAVGSNMLVSYATVSSVNNHVDSIITVAAGLQLATPFLAYYMTSLGAGSLMQLAGSLSGGVQAGIGAAAQEVSTGNRGTDNVNENNSSKNISNANKLDHNMQHFDGVNSIHDYDGGIKRTNPNGSVVFSGGAGMTTSAGSVRFNMEDNLQNQFSQGIQQSDAMVERSSSSYTGARSNTMNKASDVVAQLAQREHNGESFNYDSMGEQGKSLRQAVNETRTLHDKHGYAFNQAGQMTLEAHAKGSTPLKAITGVDIGGGVTGALSASNTSEQSLHDDKSVDRGNHTDQSYNNIVRAASNSSWAKENSLDTRLSEEVRASYAEEQRYEEQLSKAQESSKNWHDAKTRHESSGTTMNKDRYDDVMDALVKGGHAKSRGDARHLIESGAPVVKKVWNGMVSRDLGSFMGGVSTGKNEVQGSAAIRELNDFRQQHESKVNKDPKSDVFEEIQAAMDKYGFNPRTVQKEMSNAGTDLKGKYSQMTGENATQYKAVKKYNEMEERELQQRAEQYEQDRIGQGVISKSATEGLNWITQGMTGNRIGGPDQGTGQDYDHSTKPVSNLNNSTVPRGERDATEQDNVSSAKDLPEITADQGMQKQLEAFKARTVKFSTIDLESFQKARNDTKNKE